MENNEINLEKLLEESKECPSFIYDLIEFCYKNDPEKLKEIIKNCKNNSDLIDVSEIDYNKLKNI